MGMFRIWRSTDLRSPVAPSPWPTGGGSDMFLGWENVRALMLIGFRDSNNKMTMGINVRKSGDIGIAVTVRHEADYNRHMTQRREYTVSCQSKHRVKQKNTSYKYNANNIPCSLRTNLLFMRESSFLSSITWRSWPETIVINGIRTVFYRELDGWRDLVFRWKCSCDVRNVLAALCHIYSQEEDKHIPDLMPFRYSTKIENDKKERKKH